MDVTLLDLAASVAGHSEVFADLDLVDVSGEAAKVANVDVRDAIALLQGERRLRLIRNP